MDELIKNLEEAKALVKVREAELPAKLKAVDEECDKQLSELDEHGRKVLSESIEKMREQKKIFASHEYQDALGVVEIWGKLISKQKESEKSTKEMVEGLLWTVRR